MLRNIILPSVRTCSQLQVSIIRNKHKRYPKEDKTLKAAAESLAARGFLRPYKQWEPPANIEETINKICSENGLNIDSDLDSLDKKFVVLNACYKETGHSVPNSLLHTIETIEGLVEFYKTPVDTTTPFDSLLKMDLPKNLHIQENYIRFHPEKDTLFNGKSAFPKSSTIVTGLKSRKKYEGYTAKTSWP
ncbi:hypothetical protein ACJJTC_008594 [Scirpophaga incertulas]